MTVEVTGEVTRNHPSPHGACHPTSLFFWKRLVSNKKEGKVFPKSWTLPHRVHVVGGTLSPGLEWRAGAGGRAVPPRRPRVAPTTDSQSRATGGRCGTDGREGPAPDPESIPGRERTRPWAARLTRGQQREGRGEGALGVGEGGDRAGLGWVCQEVEQPRGSGAEGACRDPRGWDPVRKGCVGPARGAGVSAGLSGVSDVRRAGEREFSDDYPTPEWRRRAGAMGGGQSSQEGQGARREEAGVGPG